MNRSIVAVPCIVLALIALGAGTFIAASETRRQTVGGLEAVSQGLVEALAVDQETGYLGLAPKRAQFLADGQIAYVWDVAYGPQGELYAATGSEGKVFKIVGEETNVFCNVPQPQVFSVVHDGKGTLYAGTGPQGAVYSVDESGTVSIFYQSEDLQYVWDLAVGPDGAVYAATGPDGKVIKLRPGAEPSVVLDSGDEHVMCIALDAAGNLYAGTSGKGLLVKVTPEGGRTILFDAAQSEIHAIALDVAGNLYFGTSSDVPGLAGAMQVAGVQSAGARAVATPAAGVSLDNAQQLPTVSQPTAQRAAGPPSMRPGMPSGAPSPNALYRYDATGNIVEIFKKPGAMVLSVACVSDGVYFGTGPEGELFRADASLRVSQVVDFEETQVLSMVVAGDGAVATGTGNSGRTYVLGPAYAQKGSFTAGAIDGGLISQWGKAWARGDVPSGTEVLLAARSGNVQEPDDTWSEWSEDVPAGSGVALTPPQGRFIQLRATLTTSDGQATPVLKRVEFAYLQANQPPRLTAVAVGSSSSQASGTSSEKSSSAQTSQTQGKSVQWQAEDPNGDTLIYDLFYRGVDEATWKEIKKDLSSNSHPWNTKLLADGWYVVKVVASDRKANPKDRAYDNERLSEPFVIDNTPPEIVDVTPTVVGKRCEVKLKARDALSFVNAMAYSVDGKDWEKVYPVDRLFDDLEEEATFAVDDLPEGQHTIAIQASDAAGNTRVTKINVTVESSGT